jgi:hypothetical protein
MLTANPRVLFIEDQAYLDGTKEYRLSCGFDPLKLDKTANFTGNWKLNDCESEIPQGAGPGSSPYKLTIDHKSDLLHIKSFSISEWSDDEVSEQTLTLDGKDNSSTVFGDSPRVQNANWTRNKDTLTIDSRVSLNFGENPVEIKSRDVLTLQKRGKKLVIIQKAEGFRGSGPIEAKLVYDKL